MYENKAGQTPEARKVKELEDEIQKTKTYYNKRIKEIEDKYKFGKVQPDSKPPTKPNKEAAQRAREEQENPAVDVRQYEHQIE